MENGERSPECVGGIGTELAQLAHRGIHALKKMIKGCRQPAEFVVGGSDWQGAPESFAVRYAIGHEGGMFRESGNRRKASAHVESGNQRSDQEAYGEKEQSDTTEVVQHAIGAKRGNRYSQNKGIGSLLKGYQRDAYGLAGTKRHNTEGWRRGGNADPFQVHGSF